MNKPNQISKLEQRFKKYNPDSNPQCIDFQAYIDETLQYWENLECLKRAYPQYIWEDPQNEIDRTEAEYNEYVRQLEALEVPEEPPN